MTAGSDDHHICPIARLVVMFLTQATAENMITAKALKTFSCAAYRFFTSSVARHWIRTRRRGVWAGKCCSAFGRSNGYLGGF